MKKNLILVPFLFAGVLVGCQNPSTPSENNSVEETPVSEAVSEEVSQEETSEEVSQEEVSEVLPSIEEKSESESYVEAGYAYFNPNGVVDWYIVNAYAWDASSSELTASWPGSNMEYDDSTGYYRYFLGENITTCNIIFNDGTAQTADLVYESSKPVYQLTGSGLKGVWTAIGEVVEVNIVEETPYYLRGSFDSWGVGENFTKVSEDVYTLTMDMAAGVEFKVATADWSWETSNIQGPAAASFSSGHGEYSSNLRCEVAGNYTFELTVSTAVISVSQN